MGWIQTSAKNFSEKVPNKLIAFEVWEPVGFTGGTIHLIKSSIAVDRAHREVFETEADATQKWEHPFPTPNWQALEKTFRRS